jgi:DNA-binding NarL/FixJ family response regulator
MTISMRILIADDNARIRQGVRNLLESATLWEVCGEAKDSAEAIQRAAELLPDIVLLDINMPGLSGLEAARILRKEVPEARILMMSQDDPSLLLPRALEVGAWACIDKSRLSTDLLSTIERVAKEPEIPRNVA